MAGSVATPMRVSRGEVIHGEGLRGLRSTQPMRSRVVVDLQSGGTRVNSRKRRLRKVKGRQQACIGWGNLVTLGMFLRLPL